MLARELIDVWWRRNDRDLRPDMLARADASLIGAELDANRGLASDARRREHLLTRAMVRTLAARYLGRPRDEIVFEVDGQGRPSVASPAADGLTFSIAHTEGVIVCAFGRDRRIGVDVELKRPHGAVRFLVDYLSAFEVSERARLGTAGGDRGLLETWVLKEAYLKALGSGLAAEPAGCSFLFSPEGAPSLRQGVEADRLRASDWSFAFLDLSPDHLTAVGYSMAAPEVVRVRVRCFSE